MILGIDEVGRGSWAGPLVVGAVVLDDDTVIDGLTDSKKLTARRRALLDIEIREKALGWGLGWVQADELDEIGLSAALKLATVRAVEAVTVPYHEIILDGTVNFLKDTNKGRYVTTMPKADLLVPAVSAASIIAKVARDTFMEHQDIVYEGYKFSSHVGYGTAAHQKALNDFGITPLHRKSFAPIAKIIGNTITPTAEKNSKISSKSLGARAEAKAAHLLETVGHTILSRNWKNKYCEIDIISSKNNILYFTEVKFRSSLRQGGALATVTPKKLQQMKFAAEFYIHTLSNQSTNIVTLNPRLAVVAIEPGKEPAFLEVV